MAARRQSLARAPVRAAVWGANAVHMGRTLAWLVGTEIRSANTPVPELNSALRLADRDPLLTDEVSGSRVARRIALGR